VRDAIPHRTRANNSNLLHWHTSFPRTAKSNTVQIWRVANTLDLRAHALEQP
jgi:hypothetical protein